MDEVPGSEDDGGMVYLHIMVRGFCMALGALVLSSLCAQNDTIFPNVSAELTFAWPCKEPGTGFYWNTYTHTFQAEPVVLMDSLEWGTLDPGNPTALIAVIGDKVLYHGVDGSYVPAGTTIVLYDFGLSVGDTAYWDDYYTDDYVSVVQIDTIEVVGRERRQFTLTNGDRWLEGIGSLMGLFRPFYMESLGCADPVFTYCAEYTDVDGAAYSICSEDIPAATAEYALIAQDVYPNPGNGLITIVSPNAHVPYQVLDACGRTVARGRLQGREARVDMTSMRAGLYVVLLDGRTSKLIIE